ncbi:DUF1642 domain-containing protein [Lactiplantibacillus plantarum]|uniref:DUF1642 domain-containing protein n=1 Tax=Lactiplantibacillus plantarum TaxID=1590 RepID=UPI00217E5FEF|nr:DUF1642 domain-containing protein [Lactiplantibacillus plantarum]MCS6157990.1 DUF1642 domain-containing protein [Lactiplantibacillus plantarum]
MKFYRKQPIEAEQFDGSSDLFIKYDMIDIGAMCEERHSPEVYMSGDHRKVTIGDWIITDNFNHHTLMTDKEFQQQYAELPVIPKVYGDTIEEFKSNHYRLDEIFTEWDWNYDEQELIARAWLDGYVVEEGK